MRTQRLSADSVFAFAPELEPVWGALALLGGEEKALASCREVYGDAQLAVWQKEHRFLFECFEAVKGRGAVNLMDALLELPAERFALEELREALLALPARERVWRLLDMESVEGAGRGEVELALTDGAALDRLYARVAGDCGSFLAFSAFVQQNGRFLAEFFALARKMRSRALLDALGRQESRIEDAALSAQRDVEALGPLGFSEKVMGKTFKNRGPYAEFVFLPSLMMPYRCVRYYQTDGERRRQLVFFSLRDPDRRREDTVRALRAVADGTRYQILTLLAGEGPQRGMDIAKKVAIAASTVSHHMEQLKEGGLITEEQVKNSKYYGLDRKSAALLLDELKKDLRMK